MDDDQREIYARLNQLEINMATLTEWKGNMDRLHTDLLSLVQEMNVKLDVISSEGHQRIGADKTRSKMLSYALGLATVIIGGLTVYVLM